MKTESLDNGYESEGEYDFARSPENLLILSDAAKFEKRFEVQSLLTKSANGVLYNGFDRKKVKPVVIKQIPRKNLRDFHDVRGRLVPSEIFYHLKAAKISSKVIKPIAWFEKKSSFVLVMEKIDNFVDLWTFCSKIGPMKEQAAAFIFRQIFEVAHALHRAGLVHRDLKDENVLIDPDSLEIKVIDFGCATASKSHFSVGVGTPEYFPPEWFETAFYQPEPLTIYSLGAIWYILLTGCWIVENGFLKREFLNERHISVKTKALLDSLLCYNPVKRASFETVNTALKRI